MPKTVVKPTVGVIYNVLCSVFFALIYAYALLLKPLAGSEIYGWRILATIPCLSVLIVLTRSWDLVRVVWNQMITDRIFLLTRLLSSLLVGSQVWLFMWAPVNGYALEVSLGYFLLPITTVVVGYVFLKERLSRWQQLACLFAILAICNQALMVKALAWPTLFVCLGYPWYFLLRKVTHTGHLGALWFDLVISVPVCLWFIAEGSLLTQGSWSLFGLILGLGVMSMIAFAFQALSTPHLSLALFGLLIYVEPVLLMCVSFMIGESISKHELLTYIMVWFAVTCLIIEGIQHLKIKKA